MAYLKERKRARENLRGLMEQCGFSGLPSMNFNYIYVGIDRRIFKSFSKNCQSDFVFVINLSPVSASSISPDSQEGVHHFVLK